MKRVKTVALFLYLAAILSISVYSQNLRQAGFVNDGADVLSKKSVSALERQLAAFKKFLNIDINIVTVKTTAITPIVDFTESMAQNRKFDWLTNSSYGMLIVVSVKDGKYYTLVSRNASVIFGQEYLNGTQKELLRPAFAKKKFYVGFADLLKAFRKRFVEYSDIKLPDMEEHFERADPSLRLEYATQAVVVTTKDESAIQGKAKLFERAEGSDNWSPVGEIFPVVVGKSGLAWSEDMEDILKQKPFAYKKEGDGKSPAGIFNLTFAFGSYPKPINARLPFTQLEEFTECVDDVKSSHYNTVVGRMQVGNYDWKSSERMLAVGDQYGLGVFVAHNTYPINKGSGSCIFLHIWKDANSGTVGCTAMERGRLENVMASLDPKKNPVLIQMTEADYKKYKKELNLPVLKKWKLPKPKKIKKSKKSNKTSETSPLVQN